MHIMPVLQKGLRMKWIVKCKENNQQKRKKMCMGNLFQKNCYKRFLQKMMMCNENSSLKTWVVWLSKTICQSNLWRVSNLNGWLCTFVQELILFLKGFS